MKFLINILSIILAVALQVTVMAKISIFGAMINLPLVIMISLILIKRNDLASYWLFAGFLLDIFSSGQFGLYLISFLLVYFVINFITRKILFQDEIYFLIMFFVIGLAIVDAPQLIYNFSLTILVGDIIINTVFGYLIFWLIKYYLEPQAIIKIKI